MSKKIRYINDKEDLNIGFSEIEIEKLIKQFDFNFPKSYIDFLQIAGKKSNVLNSKKNEVINLIQLQDTLRSKIKNSDINNFNSDIWCFLNLENEYYYFELNNESNPIVFLYNDIIYPVDNGWNNKLGIISKKSDFIEFINTKTENKYGITILQKIKSYIILILSAPILLFIFIFLSIGKRLK